MNGTRRLLTFLAGWIALGAATAQGQAVVPSGPPQVLKIEREWVKPGKSDAHDKLEAEYPKLAAKLQLPVHWLTMESETGPDQMWALVAYDSFDGWQKAEKLLADSPIFAAGAERVRGLDAELLSRNDTLAAVFDETLSYRPEADWGKMQFYLVTTFQIRAGHDAEFLEIVKLTREAHVEANIDEHWVVYRIISGAPTGTYLVFAPMKAMKELDERDARHKPYLEALGKNGEKRLHELEAVAYERESEDVFAVNPNLSYVSKEWNAAEPGFWNPKPAAARPAPRLKKMSAPPPKP